VVLLFLSLRSKVWRGDAAGSQCRRLASFPSSFPGSSVGMTGYTVHTGSTEKFVSGWDQVFGKKKSGKKATGKAAATRTSKKAKAKKKGK